MTACEMLGVQFSTIHGQRGEVRNCQISKGENRSRLPYTPHEHGVEHPKDRSEGPLEKVFIDSAGIRVGIQRLRDIFIMDPQAHPLYGWVCPME